VLCFIQLCAHRSVKFCGKCDETIAGVTTDVFAAVEGKSRHSVFV